MYEELVAHLRACAEFDQAENTFEEAANAILNLNSIIKSNAAAHKTVYLNLAARIPIWNSVKKILPEKPGVYLAYAPTYTGGSSRGKEAHGGIMFSKWTGKCWGIEVGYYNRPGCVTHWMRLPEPPRKEDL